MSPARPDQPDRVDAGPSRPSGAPDAGRRAERDRESGRRGGSPERRADRERDLGRRGARPRVPRQRSLSARRAPLPVAAAVAAGWAALVSYLPVAAAMSLGRFGGPVTTPDGALRAGLAAWLLGHGVPLPTSAGPVGLVPLAVSVLAGWRLLRAGVHVTRAIGARHRGTVRQALAVGPAVGIGYGVLGALAALGLGQAGPAVSPVRAGLTLAVFGTVAALLGALPATGVLGGWLPRTPPVLRDGLRTGAVAALLLLGAGAGAAGLAVATGGGEAGDMIGAYRTGVAGQAGITLLSLAYAPNASVWAASYLLGPGFAVGAGTVVRVTEVTVGGLPAVPLLAGLPTGPVGGLGAFLLAVPVLAGAAAGTLLVRRLARASGRDAAGLAWGPLLAAAAVAGPAGGVLLGLLALAAGGPLGGGRLTRIGPDAWQTGAVAAAVLALGALLGAALTRTFYVARRRPRVRR
ncbi:DUF6350 family protein [Plantactinospora siamensis]|uniref:DUF6350 family protein n=1 Tax=Plantactinospora siamensis TaxID=555372 RepID=A0ABV6NQK7_9ACTN